MKTHFCPVENTTIDFDGKCNWCGEKEWQGLSDDEILEIERDARHYDWNEINFARAIEQALKEKNANNN